LALSTYHIPAAPVASPNSSEVLTAPMSTAHGGGAYSGHGAGGSGGSGGCLHARPASDSNATDLRVRGELSFGGNINVSA
jgi:hypothetical protein